MSAFGGEKGENFMKYKFRPTPTINGTLVRPTKENSYAMPSKVVMYPVFINQEEERMFTKRANECMIMGKRFTTRKV